MSDTHQKTKQDYIHLSTESNWRVTKLSNGYYQAEVSKRDKSSEEGAGEIWHPITRRKSIDGVRNAIYGSIKHYKEKLEFFNGPVVVETFKNTI